MEEGEEATCIQELEDDATAKDAELTDHHRVRGDARRLRQLHGGDRDFGRGAQDGQSRSSCQPIAHHKDLATAATAKKTADDLSKQAHALNAKTQADPKTGEVTAEEAKKRAEEVATAAGKAKAAEIVPRAPRRRRRTRGCGYARGAREDRDGGLDAEKTRTSASRWPRRRRSRT